MDKKEQELKIFKVREENNELNHQMIVLGIKKKEALEKATNLKNSRTRRRWAGASRTLRRTSNTPRQESTA